jgi:hypothetical protein
MGEVLRFPNHVRASAIKKSSIRTSPPVASLSRFARRIEAPLSRFKIKDKCDSEHSQSEASLDWLIRLVSSHAASGCFVSMVATLLLAKSICQAVLCWPEMDMHSLIVETSRMVKPQISPTSKPARQLYVGLWIRALGFTPAEVARGAPINEGYLSEIISGKKANPSAAKLMLIAEFLDMPLGDLYKQPPPSALLGQLDNYDPNVIVRLSKKRRQS